MKDLNQGTRKKLHYELTEKYFRNGALDRRGYYDTKKKRQLMIRNISSSIFDKIFRENPRIKKVIDVGCGTGDLVLHLAKKFPQIEKITGIDFLKEIVNIASKNAKNFKRIFFLEGNLLNIPFEDRSFDVTFCINVLHHVHKEDFEKAIKELTRITDKNIILDIRNKKNIFNLWFEYIAPPLSHTDLPIYTNSISEVNSIMQKNNFRLQKDHGVIPLKRTGWRVILVYKRINVE